MATTLDLKSPTVVVLGFWNGAILNQPAWVLQHLLEVPEGEDREVRNVTVAGQQGLSKQIWLFDDLGASVLGSRAEFYEVSETAEQAIYDFLRKLADVLPHTPIQAVGVNFRFVVQGDIAGLTPNFETNEPLDQFGQISHLERTDTIIVPDDELPEIGGLGKPPTSVKLTRKTSYENVEIDFNFHLGLPGISSLVDWVAIDPINLWRSKAASVMHDCYGIDEWQTAGF